ncbi:MAG: hypothetical protein KatS3mg024_1383 [Armatimonadota bacterium]|nr:MAG: hypothetical protein KatS3mg024_1383 [Armatimonadota bacterium]
MATAEKGPVYVVQHNHFDPIWRRCWERPFDYRGKRYRPYCELEEYFIEIWLETAQKGAVFSEGQAEVFRKFLENNPEQLTAMRKLVKEGAIELTAAGLTVPDTNMPSGETLVRNLAAGQWYFEETFGVIPDVGWLEDAFGQSAQIPQIYRGCGCRSVQKLSYKRVPGDYWKGLDGTVIFTKDPERVTSTGGGIKIAPCPACDGMGCPKCGYRGLANTSHATDEEIIRALETHDASGPWSLVHIGGEEAVPNPRVVELVEQARQQLGLDIRFGGYTLMNRYHAEEIARADDPGLEVSGQVEANPVSTGCYVSRIKVKQRFRDVENFLITAEKWATVGHLLGEEYPESLLEEAWRQLLFCAFHDAITGTHIDTAYHEIHEMLDNAERLSHEALAPTLDLIEERIKADEDEIGLVLYNAESWTRTHPVRMVLYTEGSNPSFLDADGNPVRVLDIRATGSRTEYTILPPPLPPLGYATILLAPEEKPADSGVWTDGPGVFETGVYRVTVSERGISSITDLRTGYEISDAQGYLINELVLEEDIGHPWGTMQPPSFEERLGSHTTRVRTRRGVGCHEVAVTGEYRGSDTNTRQLLWIQRALFYDGEERIDFETEIEWDTAQRRIRIAFPTGAQTEEATYSIPYGALKRGPYEPDMSGYPSTNGDWPAVYWVDVQNSDKDCGVALINQGTPSHRVRDGVLFLSVLRSPTDSWCLNEPEFYDCPDFDGARDAGAHEFSYSLILHRGDFAEAGIERRAREVNSPVLIRPLLPTGTPRKQDLGLTESFMDIEATDNVILTALKRAEKDDSVIIRLAETAGKRGSVRLSLRGARPEAHLTDYLERNLRPVDGAVSVGPWKVLTIRQDIQ